jgi:hypothetical protein
MVVLGKVGEPAFLSTPGGSRMSKELKMGKGSKRAVRRIRWNGSEIASFIALMIILSIIAVLAGLWVGSHHID